LTASPFLRVLARWSIPVLLLLLAGGVVAVNLVYVEAAPARSDFVARWEGGRAWAREGLSPYDPLVSVRAQERVYGRPANADRGEDPQHFLYPFPSLLIFAPLGLLNSNTAHAIWLSLIELALLASTLLWASAVQWKWSTWMAAAMLGFSALWFPAFAAIVNAQYAAVEALVLAICLSAIRAGRDAVGGVLLAASLFKPQLGVGFVVYIVVWAIVVRRGALLGWFVTSLVALGGTSLLVDPSWPAGMARQMIEYLALPVSLSPLARLAGSLGLGNVGAWVLSGIVLLYLAWEWKDSLPGDERRLIWTLGMTQAVVLLVAPFGIAANLVTLLLPIVVILEAWYGRQGRSVDAPAIILLLLVGVFSWLVSLESQDSGQPSLWLVLGVPLLTMVGLFWVRWWSTRARAWSDLGGRVASDATGLGGGKISRRFPWSK
jgi:hypothetical protein